MRKQSYRKLRFCYELAVEKKCDAIKLFDVRGISSITDFVLLVTCNSEPHLRAFGNALSVGFKENFHQICQMDYQPSSGWLVLDAFDIMVHATTEEARGVYQLDQLWAMAPEIDSREIFPIDIYAESAGSVR